MKNYLLVLISWLCLQAIAWHVEPLCSLFSFVPLFHVLHDTRPYKQGRVYLLILSWNVLVLFWLCQMDLLKGVESILFNTSVLFLPVYASLRLQKYLPKYPQIPIFICFWIFTEYIHHHWFLSFPWLTLGNAFGASPQWVQWYAYTGVLGGSVWVLACNGIFYDVFKQKKRLLFARVALIVSIPMAFSYYLFRIPAPHNTPNEVLFVQSNIEYHRNDSYKIEMLFETIKPLISAKTNYLLLPETFFSSPLWETQLRETVLYLKLKNLLSKYPQLRIIFGANLKKLSQKPTKNKEMNFFYEKYNVAIQIDTSLELGIKEKAIFVPIEEYVPEYLYCLPLKSDYLSKPSVHASAHLGKAENPLFVGICYEMVNSFFVNKYIKTTDKAIFMLSSEEFLKGSETGMKQYLNICRLRSVETGLPLIKSSSKGYAAAISAKGELSQIFSPKTIQSLQVGLSKF